jgi:hypothetical protein
MEFYVSYILSMPMNPEERELRTARRTVTGTNGMSTANRKAALNRNITWFEGRYPNFLKGQFGRTPSNAAYMQYTRQKRELRNMNRAAKRIQTAVRTLKNKKAAAQQLSFLNNFRRLNQTDQRAILKLAFKI